MKKIILTVALATAGVFSSCTDDFIDLEPKDILTDNLAFVSFNDVESSLIGSYALVRGYSGVNYTFVPDILADQATQTSENQGQQVFFHNWQYSADDNGVAPIWFSLYSTIRAANTTLAEVDNFEAEQQDRDRVRGQSLAIRAMAHFDLLRYFTDFNDPSAPGVPIKLIADEVTTPPRNTVGEVFAQIESDLTQARNLLQGVPAQEHFISVDAVLALSSRVALYQQNWPEAIQFSSELIQSRSLATGSDFVSVWVQDSDRGTGEIIFSVSVEQGEGAIGQALFNEVGNPLLFWAPSESLLSLYDFDNDIRFSTYFKVREDDPSQFVDNKYRGRRASQNVAPANPGLHDYKTFRLSEQYLIRAEARAKSGDTNGANADLNALRRARIAGYTDVSLSGDALLEAIEIERRKELAFEGHRWFDIKRNNEAVVRGAGCEASPAINCTLEAGNFRFLLPIPQDEVFANENMVQNPGYSN